MLSPQEVEQYNQDGYIHCKGVICEEIKELIDEISLIIKDQLQKKGTPAKEDDDLKTIVKSIMQPKSKERQFIYDIASRLHSVRKIQTSEKIIGRARDLGLQLPFVTNLATIRMDLVGKDEAKYLKGPHQDFRLIKSAKSCTVWFPLTTCNEENGTIIFYPNTHKDGIIEHELVLNLEIPKDKLPKEKMIINAEPGDVLIFSSLAIHESKAGTAEDGMKMAGLFGLNDALAVNIGDEYESLNKELPRFHDLLKDHAEKEAY